MAGSWRAKLGPAARAECGAFVPRRKDLVELGVSNDKLQEWYQKRVLNRGPGEDFPVISADSSLPQVRRPPALRARDCTTMQVQE